MMKRVFLTVFCILLTVTAEPVPKKPDVWPIVAAGGAVLLIAAGVAAFLLGRKK